MQIEQQHMILISAAHEEGSHQRSLVQCKRALRLAREQGSQFALPGWTGLARKIDQSKGERAMDADDLARRPVLQHEGGPEDFVAPDNRVQSSLQNRRF